MKKVRTSQKGTGVIGWGRGGEGSPNILREEINMDKNTCRVIPLATGQVRLYDFGAVNLHTYESGDPIQDQTLW